MVEERYIASWEINPRRLLILKKTCRLLQQAGDQLGMGMAYNKLGVAYMEMSDFSRARNYF